MAIQKSCVAWKSSKSLSLIYAQTCQTSLVINIYMSLTFLITPNDNDKNILANITTPTRKFTKDTFTRKLHFYWQFSRNNYKIQLQPLVYERYIYEKITFLLAIFSQQIYLLKYNCNHSYPQAYERYIYEKITAKIVNIRQLKVVLKRNCLQKKRKQTFLKDPISHTIVPTYNIIVELNNVQKSIFFYYHFVNKKNLNEIKLCRKLKNFTNFVGN
eukprot:TRINITY_DN3763_c0_g1_i3.p2 TRINITY_DN3763_c0_g1~~TRINITY_DN3763_c0_g1_i3.p2  ORF type:complete len:215 (+),score=-0.50 TRINITY_DN3763_c0_g1_i3:1050-1694(+)